MSSGLTDNERANGHDRAIDNAEPTGETILDDIDRNDQQGNLGRRFESASTYQFLQGLTKSGW